MPKRSRLKSRLEERSKKNMAISLIVLVALVAFLIKFGVPLFAGAGLFISGLKNNAEAPKEEKIFVAPPVLNPLPDATSSARIEITGRAEKDQEIKIYVNDGLAGEDLADEDGDFSKFVELEEKDNNIKARAHYKNFASDFSNTLQVKLLTEPPKLEISFPSDGQKFEKENKRIEIKGTTDPGVRVTVNDFVAIVDDEGNFSYHFGLKDGDNEIKIVAQDDAGNKTEKALKVTYSP